MTHTKSKCQHHVLEVISWRSAMSLVVNWHELFCGCRKRWHRTRWMCFTGILLTISLFRTSPKSFQTSLGWWVIQCSLFLLKQCWFLGLMVRLRNIVVNACSDFVVVTNQTFWWYLLITVISMLLHDFIMTSYWCRSLFTWGPIFEKS